MHRTVGAGGRGPRAEGEDAVRAILLPCSGIEGRIGSEDLEVQPLLKMILCASNQYSRGCSRFNTSKVEGSYNPISSKL